MIRAALVGTGRIAHQHLACLRRQAGVELAAVCDLSPVSAEFAAERYGAGGWFTDHRRMLAAVRPDVVHVTTPPESHFAVAADALDAGAHVVVEKPAALRYDEVLDLLARAEAAGRSVVEDYNYVFNRPVRRLLELVRSGAAGSVVHVQVDLCLDIRRPGSPFADRNLPHPALQLRGGAIADFLPHLASLAHAFVGPHHEVATAWAGSDNGSALPYDEMRAVVAAERGSAGLCFSARAQPDVFAVTLLATRLRARAGLFEPRLTVDRVRPLPKPLVPFANALEEGVTVAGSAFAGVWGKLSGGPGSYEGLWELVSRTYSSLASGAPPPVSLSQVAEVNRLVDDLLEGAAPR